MTELNPDIPDRPIEVPATATGAQAATGSRDVLILLAALPALVAVLGTRDVNAIVAWIGSSEGIQVAGAALAFATFAWRQWLARKQHVNEVRMAISAPDTIAVVKEVRP